MQDHASKRRDQRHHTFRREVIVIGDEMGSQPRSAGRISGRTFSHRGNDQRVVSGEVLTGGTMSNGTLNGRGRSLQMLGALRSTFQKSTEAASSPPLSAEMHQVFAHAAALSGGLLPSPRPSCFSGRQQRLQSAVASAALEAKQSFN
ncbi:hypothetical protein [Bradyrhizobium sp. WSM471]|uniref:hypothetical protein n=1 Tax=Bradyrhizobium sp. WSM471 TaxID=319017 RepID=UPI0012FCE4D5|nr:MULTISPECIES: hypothetical protein [Bradyrhizobium]UFW42966.1 hypothetical protein BcanWSM471_07430 [Bradyrhizobium canariense]